MCGIIGYVGQKEALPILIDGLKKLEYRGYDSSGVGIVPANGGKIIVRKTQGKIKNLEELIRANGLPKGTIGISHTRWATHGHPNQVNAHPHFDGSRKTLLVHNGIIENYQPLKESLKKEGHRFLSETDTEVIAHLIQKNNKGNFFEAVRKTALELEGAFALGVICSEEPDTLIAVRTGSPLIIGLASNGNFIASDVPAILDYTKKVIYLEDRQIAIIKRDDVKIFTFGGKRVVPKVSTIAFKVGSAQKEGYPHFMLKEIHEQPKVLEQMFSTRLSDGKVDLAGTGLSERQLKEIDHVFIVACGTAYHAGLVGKYIIERLSGVPVAIDVSSEFRYRDPIIDRKTLIVAISQSGETADTLAAVREAKKKGAKIVSVCNVVGSSLARESDGILYTHAGPEIGVASTKAYTAQLGMLYLLALKLAGIRNTLSSKERQEFVRQLKKIPSLMAGILEHKRAIARVAHANSHYGCFLFLGRNINYPSALEGALKLKEISYIPAEGYAAGEMKHGPIALIDEYRAVVCITPDSELYDKMISNIQEIRSRRGKIIAIVTEGNEGIRQHANHVLFIPKTDPLLTPLLVALPLQLLAYYISAKLGCDIDQPRNLAKSVTVE
jgi:glucosamine--fructose-6-phosphate aminotransferase (isomerizing)